MSGKFDNSRGNVKIANSVISRIAGYAAVECYGVAGLAASGGKDSAAKLLRREQMDKGVKIKVSDGGVEIVLNIIAEYGTNVNAVGEMVVSRVKYVVEEMVGLGVKNVDVNIVGIRV